MKRLVLGFVLFFVASARATYTEFYVNPLAGSNSNLYSGSTQAAPVYTGVGDSDGTSVFTPSDGSTPSGTVNPGDFVSVYVTAGATVATCVARVQTVAAGVNGAITIVTTAKAGTFPAASGGAHTITLVDGGPWSGPSGAVGFPFGFATGALTSGVSGVTARVNLKATTYNVTAAIAASGNGPLCWQGYNTTPGDNAPGSWGIAVIDGGGTGAAYTLMTTSGTDQNWQYIRFNRNGATGGGSPTQGVATTGSRNWFYRCICSNMVAAGFYAASTQSYYLECEAYGCNSSNTSDRGAFYVAVSGTVLRRCVAHDSTGNTNCHGFGLDQTVTAERCISYNNSGAGFYSKADQYNMIVDCDAYNNGLDGYWNDTATTTLNLIMENCNFFKNGGYGVKFTNVQHPGRIDHCAFGSGTMANTNGQVIAGVQPIAVTNSVTYASGQTPWSSPSTGDFRIVNPASFHAGVGTFWQSTTTPVNVTVGYPDVGAATHASVTVCVPSTQ